MKLTFSYTNIPFELQIGNNDTQWIVLRRNSAREAALYYKDETRHLCNQLIDQGVVAVCNTSRGLVCIHSSNTERDLTYYTLKYGDCFELFKIYQGSITERMQGSVREMAGRGMIVDWVDYLQNRNRYAY